MFYVFAFIICAVVLAFVAAPLFRERRAWVGLPAPARRAMLLDERDMLLRDLKDLEFDRRMGKIDDADYAELRATTAGKATQVLNALEGPPLINGAALTNGRALLDREIEAEVMIARARLKAPLNAPKANDWTCTCGRRMGATDKFCGNCGASKPQDV